MIKQFNFYDIYGYLLPGMLLLGLFWLPLGVLTQTWPDQDISKALFLASLAYVVGHLLQTVANSVVPSTVLDDAAQTRFPSDLFLDKSNSKFTKDVKNILSRQVKELFGLGLEVTQDGDGKNDVSKNRQTAFFQARAYLIVKKAANYVEQFEGLYAMMRGLGCSFLVGAVYFAGWGLSFHRDHTCLLILLAILFVIGIVGALASACAALLPKAKRKEPEAEKPKDKKPEGRKPAWKKAAFWLALCLLLVPFCSGFWVSVGQQNELWSHPPAFTECVIWASVFLALIAAARCFSAYKAFAEMFAVTVWRDFSAYLSFQGTSAPLVGDSSDES